MTKRLAVMEHCQEIVECMEILDELSKTAESYGEYCPYNLTFPYQRDVVHEVREILRKKVEEEGG